MDANSSGFFNSMPIMWALMAVMIVGEVSMWWIMSKMHRKIFKRIKALEAHMLLLRSKEK
jgi:hypothetical protein